jgi:phosphatidylglycerophosphate synthase
MTPNRARAAVAGLATPVRDSVRTTADPICWRRSTRPVQLGLGPAMFAQLLLVTTLMGIVTLSGNGPTAAGWAVGISCGVITNLGLSRALSHFRADRLTPADCVTLTRATLAAVVAALVADSFVQPVSVTTLVSLAAVALVLDAVDGWVARRTAIGNLGANFDAEVDAFLILVLSVYVARLAGAWVLLIGAARYAFLAAGWAFPWMREPLPPRYWRKFVAATEGIVLTVATANVLPLIVTRAALVGALVLLAESFGRDVLWLRIRRIAMRRGAAPDPDAVSATPGDGRRRARAVLATALTILALLFVWAALVGPIEPIHLEFSAFLRLPLEGFGLIALAVVAPPKARRVLVWVVGPLLGLVLILKLFDIGFFAAFDRPFDPYQDLRYAGIAVETLRDSVGHTTGTLILVALGALVIGVPIVMTLALRRVTRLAVEHRDGTLRTVGGLGVAWLLFWAFGAQIVSETPIASASAASLLVSEVNAVQADIQDHSVFAREISHDRFAATPANQLLTGLRGKDVLLLFVESYGKVAVQGTSISPGVDAVLASGDKRLQAAGFSSRSGWLTSSTFGGISWLAHSTLQSGLWVDTPQRYNQLLASHRLTLTEAFDRAGWRTVDEVPSDDRPWPPGKTFYHFDQLYDKGQLGYHGPSFAYAVMPDQFIMGALQRRELAKRHRRPIFAEVDLVSSHTPWTRIPEMVPWNRLGNGSIFNHAVRATGNGDVRVNSAWSFLQINGSAPVRAAYGESIQYTLNSLVSFVQHYHDPNLVMVVLGDHQPWTVVSGDEPGHEVPISIVAHDPAVLKRVAGWGWSDGLRPSPQAPVWPMSGFRDRFLTAFGPQPDSGGSP